MNYYLFIIYVEQNLIRYKENLIYIDGSKIRVVVTILITGKYHYTMGIALNMKMLKNV